MEIIMPTVRTMKSPGSTGNMLIETDHFLSLSKSLFAVIYITLNSCTQAWKPRAHAIKDFPTPVDPVINKSLDFLRLIRDDLSLEEAGVIWEMADEDNYVVEY